MSIYGIYKLRVLSPLGWSTDVLTIKQSGNSISGSYYSPPIGTLPLSEVKVNGEEIQFQLLLKGPTGQMKVPFLVNIEGDKITGKMPMEGNTPYEITGERISLNQEELLEKLVQMQSQMDNIEKRLRINEDIEEIKVLQSQYINDCQLGKFDSIENYFAEDANYEDGPPAKGKEAIGKLLREGNTHMFQGIQGHLLAQPVIKIDGDKATGSWLYFRMHSHPKTFQMMFWMNGYFDMEYIRDKGRWKILHLRYKHHLMPPGLPPNEKYLLSFLPNAYKAMQDVDLK